MEYDVRFFSRFPPEAIGALGLEQFINQGPEIVKLLQPEFLSRHNLQTTFNPRHYDNVYYRRIEIQNDVFLMRQLQNIDRFEQNRMNEGYRQQWQIRQKESLQ